MNLIPKKSLGQNFLLNKQIIKDIVKLGNITSKSTVIEIGPGTGNLTEEILKNNPYKFFAIEKDKNLFEKLNNKFSSSLELLNQDVLNVNWNNFNKSDCIVYGNLPYNISSKILINWIMLNNLDKLFSKLILMFQKEVADRLIAKVDSSNYGRLTILREWKLSANKIMDINQDNFFPKPKVKSSLVYFEPKKKYFSFNDPRCLSRVTDIFFQNKRKMIKKPLNILFKNPSTIISKLNLDEKSRPQNLNPETFFKISKEYEIQQELN